MIDGGVWRRKDLAVSAERYEGSISALIYQGTSISNGAIASDYEATSFRALSRAYVYATYPRRWQVFNFARGGSNSWNALCRIDGYKVLEKAPRLVVTDWTNDVWSDAHDQKSREAWIRRLLPTSNLVVILWPIVDQAGNVTFPRTDHTEYKALCDHYGVPYVDMTATLYQLIEVDGGDITDYYNHPSDRVHPNDGGHTLIYTTWLPNLPAHLLGDRQYSGSLPSRYYSGSDEYENDGATYIDGTAYDAVTGTWTEASGVLSSSDAGATVTYSGSFCSIGYESAPPYPAIDYRVDGGAWVENIALDHKGRYVAAYGSHTIDLRVRTTAQINKFLAV